MNELDETTFARFAERFARIERRVPEAPPLAELAVRRRRLGRLSPILAVASVVVLLATLVGLAAIGAWQLLDGDPDSSASMRPTSSVATSSPPPGGQSAILRGRILDAGGNPVPHASVTAYPRPERDGIAGSTVTDADGRWVMPLPAGNTYCLDLAVEMPVPGNGVATRFRGYFGLSGIGQPVDAWPCMTPAGEVVLDVTLPIMRLVSGAVVDQAGDPITMAGAGGPFTRIEITIANPAMGSLSHASADGHYKVWVPEGEWNAFAWVFRDEQPFLSPATALHVGADPILDFTLTVDTGALVVD